MSDIASARRTGSAVLAVAVLLIASLAAAVCISESDAATTYDYGSADDPLDRLSVTSTSTAAYYLDQTIYVWSGSYVCLWFSASDYVMSDYGDMTHKSTSTYEGFYGYLSAPDTYVYTVEDADGDEHTVTIVCILRTYLDVDADDLVLSSKATYYVALGSDVSIAAVSDSAESYTVSAVTSNYGLTISSGSLSGTLTKIGTITVTVTYEDESSASESTTTTTTIACVDTSSTAYLYYDANDGSGDVTTKSATWEYEVGGTVDIDDAAEFTVSSSAMTRTGYEFLGWSTSSSATEATYTGGEAVTVAYGSSLTLYAVWKNVVLEFEDEPSSTSAVVGSPWTWAPEVSEDGCTIAATCGSDAVTIEVLNGTVYVYASEAGTYTVTVTASLNGYTSAETEVEVTFVSSLSFTSTPTNGAVAYVKG